VSEPTYLGDGCYVTFDGFQFWLIANDPSSIERVALEPGVFEAFLQYAAQQMGAKITVTYPEQASP
jgi:hypothetical protein